MLTKLLFPTVPGLRIRDVLADTQAIQLFGTMTSRAARCPGCRRRSHAIHSHYERRLQDLPCCGRPVVLHLRVRRFRCRFPTCRRRIFTERVPTLLAPWARRTRRARERLAQHGFALGGRRGVVHAQREGLPTSRRTLLRLVRTA